MDDKLMEICKQIAREARIKAYMSTNEWDLSHEDLSKISVKSTDCLLAAIVRMLDEQNKILNRQNMILERIGGRM